MAALDNLDGFCSPVSEFWRRSPEGAASCRDHGPNQTCYDAVDLTQCFEDTAILYAISVIFWCLVAAEFACYRSIRPRLRRSHLSNIKALLLLVPMVTALCDLFYTVYQGTQGRVAHYLYLSPIVLLVSMVLVGLVLHYERKVGIRSSASLFLFWLAMLVYGSLKLRTVISRARDEGVDDRFRLVTFCFQYATILLEFILVLFLEPMSPFIYRWGDDQDRKPCPEGDATFLSTLTWWWLNGLIWHGWRKPLEYSDLTDLNQQDKSRVVSPSFQRNWDKELMKAGLARCRARANVTADTGEYQPLSDCDVQLNPVPGEAPAQRKGRDPSLVLALCKTFWRTFTVAAFFKLGQDLLSFASPQILKLMIAFTSDKNEPSWKGYFYAFLLFAVAVVQSLLLHQYFHRCFVVGMRIRTAIIAAVYKKSLKLSNASRHTRTVGEIVNLMSVDAQRFMDLMSYLHMIWSAPLQIVLSLVFLWFSMGPSIFAGFGVMILLIPLNLIIASTSRRFQVRQMIQKDSRLKLVNEVLNGIKVIKLYAWEIPFQRLIMAIRKRELAVLRASAYLNAGSSFTWTCAPFLVALATFVTYALATRGKEGEGLTPERVFVALSLFNILRFPLSMLPFLISNIVESSVSVKRLREFLKSEELDPTSVQRRPQPATRGEVALNIQDGRFTWDTEDPVLSDVNLEVQAGQLVAVVGQVGAGKSSLIQAFLGEMDKISGTVSMRGSVAYVPQQAWIQNATVRDNILFGQTYNEELYRQTLRACALETDLEILPGGDMTEIGEKGINLSGGQKQRVSLARAVYQGADVYLLDDPLSAVDSHVGKHIFEKVIGPEGMLKGKVRLLVTNGLGFLPQCDQVVVMEDGLITESGAYAELIDNDGAFATFIRTYTNVSNEEGDPEFSEYGEFDDQEIEGPPDDGTTFVNPSLYDEGESQARRQAYRRHLARSRSRESTGKPELKRARSRSELKRQLSKQLSIQSAQDEKEGAAAEGVTLITEEKAETGRVKLAVIIEYFKACTYYMTFFLIAFYILTNGASVGSNFWLAHFSNQEAAAENSSNNSDSINLGLFLGVYAALGISQALFVLLASFTLAIGSIIASRKLHDSMLESILRSPMSFFDTTPLGRVLNRFSKDIYMVDETIPRSLRAFLMTFFSVISTIIVIVIATPIFLVIIVPLFFLYLFIQRFYVATSRQLKRLESVTRSPIYTHFQETVTGATSVRAYNAQERFIIENERRVDYNQIAYYPNISANRWLAIRLEFIGNLIILFAALFAVIQRNYGHKLNLGISPGIVGLSISYSLQVTSALNMMVRMTSELETNIVAVERTKEYADSPNEAAPIIEANRPDPDWPQQGHVKFDHYSTRYREGLDLVLKNIAAEVPGGTKVGIVGRTGAGKSSLTLALFRIIEPAGGSILIDGADITEYGLTDLRSRITIIPQDPVLFSGTLRLNLDPFQTYSDQELWESIERAHLSHFVARLTEGLEYDISEGGENLSVGQRQLVCLARALLRKTKILVLDEATAAVDMETDDLIQKTIRVEFADCTVLTIAHRLNTIMDYDRIMVLDAGRVVELDTPNALLANKNTIFYSMVRDAGLVN